MGTRGCVGRVTGLVHSIDFFFFSPALPPRFFFLMPIAFSFCGEILTLEQDKSTPNGKLNLHVIFHFASGFWMWIAKLILKQKFLLNRRPNVPLGKCSSTVCWCTWDKLFWKKTQQTSTLKKTLCSNWKGYFWCNVLIFSKIVCIEGNVYYNTCYHFWSSDLWQWTYSQAVAIDEFFI